jgi:hypothetical protein
MKQRVARILALPVALLLAHCGDANHDQGPAGGGGAGGARIETRLSAAAVESAPNAKFRAGAARGNGLESLKYQITGITICESLETTGSGFNNPNNCLQLYSHDDPRFHYEINADWTSLADTARGTDDGFVDLLDGSSRAQLASSTKLTREQARSYNYGTITWSLPIKLKAKLTMNDGSYLYTHDGPTVVETVGVDSYRSYYTAAATPLDQAPAEEAVVLLPNGGNWFKFQSPFVISEEDIEAERAFVLDLVFNPDGIVKGFSDSYAMGSLSQRGTSGTSGTSAMSASHVHDITVPMLDLSPVPHRASEQVLRESYQGAVTLADNTFDVRIELYYVEGDESGTVYGVDAKSLVNARTTSVPPELAKISFLDQAADGSLTMSAHKHTPVISGLVRVPGESGTTHVSLVCATHTDRSAVEGGSAIVVERCPSPTIDVELTLTSRTRVEGGVAAGTGSGPVVEDAGVSESDAAR